MIFALLLSPQAGVRPLADVPFTLRGVHIYTMAKVNGQGLFPLNIDTGGWMVMGAGLAKKIDLKATSQVKVGGAGAGVNSWGYAKGVKVQIGDVEIPGLESGIDTNLTSTEAGIGPELFQRFTVQFDYDHMRLRLYKKGTVPVVAGSTSVPLRFQTDAMKPLVYVKVGKAGGWFMADTGGGVSLILQRNFWQPTHAELEAKPLIRTIAAYGVGGPIFGRVGRVRSVGLGSFQLKGVLASYSDMTKGTLADPKRSGLIGQRILTRFNQVFDYANSRLLLTPNRRFDKPMSFGRTGIAGLTEDPGLKVDYVIPGSAADKAGLQKGDLVVAIDGHGVDEATVGAAFNRPVGTRLRLTVVRGDRTIEVTLVLREVM